MKKRSDYSDIIEYHCSSSSSSSSSNDNESNKKSKVNGNTEKSSISFTEGVIDPTRQREVIIKEIAERILELQKNDITKHKLTSMIEYAKKSEEIYKKLSLYPDTSVKWRELLTHVHIDSWKVASYDETIILHAKNYSREYNVKHVVKFRSNNLNIVFNNELFMSLNVTVPDVNKLHIEGAKPNIELLIWHKKNPDFKANLTRLQTFNYLQFITEELGVKTNDFLTVFWDLIYKTFMFDPNDFRATIDFKPYKVSAYGTFSSYFVRGTLEPKTTPYCEPFECSFFTLSGTSLQDEPKFTFA